MAKTVAILNQKGGVGKTTTAVNLTACVGALDKRVLLCDIDPQGNSTSGFGVDKRKIERSSYHVLVGECAAKDAVVHTAFKNVDLLPSTMDLAGAAQLHAQIGHALIAAGRGQAQRRTGYPAQSPLSFSATWAAMPVF